MTNGPRSAPSDAREAHDPVEAGLAWARPWTRRLRFVLIGLLVLLVLGRLLGWIMPGWRLLLWLSAAVVVIPAIVLAFVAGRHLEAAPPATDRRRDDDRR